ncbi:MAG: hypothetical protein COS89_04660, partial [Deltaproteobacteria bacterium CG07_land_8_20_14_0_80_38_7]
KPERYYIYGKSTDPLMELNGEGEIERLFIYLGGRRIAAFGNEEFQYYHLDEIGSVLHTTNDQGNINETVRYDPFGNINFRVGLSSERYLFASKEYDSETGLIYFGARFYDPETGRFITRDPMEQGINHYIFVGNNPLLIEEYFGLGDVIKDIGRVVVGAVVGVVTGVVTGNPITGIYAGIATTAAMFGQRFATGDDNAFMVNMSYSYGGADVPHGETSGRLGDRIHISVGPRTTSPDGRGSQESSTSYHNGCTNRLCFAIQGDGAFVSFDGGNTYVNSGSNSGGGGFGGGFSDNLGGSMGGGSGYSGSGLEISVHYGDEIINTDPLNSPNTFPSNNDAYGDDGASNMSPSGTMPNVGLPAPSSGTGSMPVVQNPDPFNFPQEDDSFIGYGEPPPVPEIVYVPLGFDQQEDTPLPSVQADMSEISANNTVADPVMLYSGDLLQVETDLKIPGLSIDYEFKRTYRSRLDYDGPLGFGWDHNYNKRLVVLKKKDGTGEKGIRRFDGNARYDDYLLEEGVYKAPAGSFDRLIKKANGTYQIRHNNGLIYDYDADGSISSMMDRNGNELTFLYTIIGEEKVLDAVIDTVGRRINYDYNGQGLLTRIVDYTGRTVRFVYDDNVNLTAVHSPAVDEFPVGKVTQYTYSDDHNLLTAINPAGQVYLENEYTTTDRVSRQYLGKDAFDFSYYRRREFYQ